MTKTTVLTLLGWAAISANVEAAHARTLRLVATVQDLGAIAREVTGPEAEITVLARPTQDPHFVDARPNFMLSLNRADAVLFMGLDYESGWLPTLVRGARNAAIQPGGPGSFDASTTVALLDVPRGPIDRAQGDIHAGGNPHFTADPRNAARIARALAARLGTLDPEGAARYTAQAEAFAKRAEARAAAWQAAFAPKAGTPIVTFHSSFAYLEAWLGLARVATLEPKPGIPPSAAHLATVVKTIAARKVNVIVQERWYPSQTAEALAGQTGARLVLVSGMTVAGQSYLDHTDEVASALASALGIKPPAKGTSP